MRRIGIFGGKFNPVHCGHLQAAQAATAALSLDALIFVPAGRPLLQKAPELIDGTHRLAMLRRAVSGDHRFAVSEIEVSRAGPSTTLETVRALKAEMPEADFVFLLGSDVVGRLHLWHGIGELRTLCRFAVLPRAGYDGADAEPEIPRIAMPAVDISSRAIRARRLLGQEIAPMTVPSVAAYIEKHDLYTPHAALERIMAVLADIGPRVVCCSGGIDSLLLATIAHRLLPAQTRIAHGVSPAVPPEATERIRQQARSEGWTLDLVNSNEFADERYLANPVNRCYFCKSHLYATLKAIAAVLPGTATLLSGANTDDLGEYRPGLDAAAEYRVRHPFVEAGIDKAALRAVARHLNLPFADLPASPCLASRIYTGTRVTPGRLRAIAAAEGSIRAATGVKILRCRVREDRMRVELTQDERSLANDAVLANALRAARTQEPGISGIELDDKPYRPGRAFVGDNT